jgi:hypothetical protein
MIALVASRVPGVARVRRRHGARPGVRRRRADRGSAGRAATIPGHTTCFGWAAMRALPGAVAILLCTLTANLRADDGVAPEEHEHEYATAGSIEVGGSLSVSWTDDLLALAATPSFGYFLWDRFELSADLGVTYTRVSDEGVTTSTKTVSFVVEPSYHYPIRDDLFLLGGLGLGVGYDGNHTDFELIPRGGINIEVGRSSLVTPSLAVPILIGHGHSESGNNIGASVGVDFEVGITTTF